MQCVSGAGEKLVVELRVSRRKRAKAVLVRVVEATDAYRDFVQEPFEYDRHIQSEESLRISALQLQRRGLTVVGATPRGPACVFQQALSL